MNVVPDALSGILNRGRRSTAGQDGDKKAIVHELLVMWSSSRNESRPVVLREDDVALCSGIPVSSRLPLYDELGWLRPPSLSEAFLGTWGPNE